MLSLGKIVLQFLQSRISDDNNSLEFLIVFAFVASTIKLVIGKNLVSCGTSAICDEASCVLTLLFFQMPAIELCDNKALV